MSAAPALDDFRQALQTKGDARYPWGASSLLRMRPGDNPAAFCVDTARAGEVVDAGRGRVCSAHMIGADVG